MSASERNNAKSPNSTPSEGGEERGGLTRRKFLKIIGASVAGVGLSQLYLPQIADIFAEAADGNPPVIWLQGASCTGCSVSLLNTVHPDIKEMLFDIISLEYHSTVMAAAGGLATERIFTVAKEAEGEFILVIEGAVPTASDGIHCTIGKDPQGGHLTMYDAVKRLGPKAAAVVGLGTCAAYGGIPAGEPDPTASKGVGEVIDAPVVNIPGCPPHPDWIVGTLAHVLKFGLPQLDHHGRPRMFYGQLIHENCPQHYYYDRQEFAEKLGDPGCLIKLGCRGPISRADCFNRQWNNGVNWCIRSRGPCIGCVNVGFPDEVSPLYVGLPEESIPDRPLFAGTPVENSGTKAGT